MFPDGLIHRSPQERVRYAEILVFIAAADGALVHRTWTCNNQSILKEIERRVSIKYTKSLVNTNLVNTNFTNTHFQKVPIPLLTRTMKQKFLH